MVRYRILPERSMFWFDARSSLHPIHIETNGFEGYIDVEVADGRLNLDASVTAQVKLETERLKTGNGLYDRELERRLEVRRYRHIKGTVREVRALDAPNRYHVLGAVTFHGATKRVEGDVTIRVLNERRLAIEGEREFDMRDFGLEPPTLLMLRVYPEIQVRGKVVAEREG